MSPSGATVQGLLPSLIDRLIDPDSMGTAARTGVALQQMVDAVRADLEELLNTRQSHQGLPLEYVETHNSIVAYGLPDLTTMNAISDDQRVDIGKMIVGIVNRFEPRLRHVRAHMVPSPDKTSRRLRFHLDASLNVDPAPEVAFETILELTTGHASIKPSER